MNNLVFTMGDSAQAIPDGSYRCRFAGVEEAPAKEYQGKMLSPGIRWQFEIVNGPMAGRKLGRITGKNPTPNSGCGKMIASLLNRNPAPGEAVDLSQCVGQEYAISVIGNKADAVMTIPK